MASRFHQPRLLALVVHFSQLGSVLHRLSLCRLLHRRDAGDVNARDLRKHLGSRFRDVLGLAKAMGVERFDQHLVHAGQGTQRAIGEVPHLLDAGLAVDVQLPTRQLGGEPHVLTPASNRERELVIRNDQLHRVVRFIPTHAPTGSTSESLEETAIFARPPGSRAAASITTIPSEISGTSISNNLVNRFTDARERMIWGPFDSLSTSIT